MKHEKQKVLQYSQRRETGDFTAEYWAGACNLKVEETRKPTTPRPQPPNPSSHSCQWQLSHDVSVTNLQTPL